MCVAVIVESKKRLTKEYLKAMSDANPHGGGVAWYDNDRVVHFRKGLSWEQIDLLQDALPRPFLMHFRIATRGEKIPELTHPFPIGMQAFTDELYGIAHNGVIIHNGTWSDYAKYVPNGIDGTKVSDTQVAAYVASFNENILNDVKWSNVIMTSKGIRYRGQWTEHEGNQYSNMHWRRELFTSRTKSYELEGWEHDGFYNNARTVTPINPRKKGKSHQEGRNQDGGRTVNQYQTQFNKSGQGVHVRQSNGKTLQENREEAKRRKHRVSGYEATRATTDYDSTRKTQPMNAVNDNSTGESPYTRAKNAYIASIQKESDAYDCVREQVRGHDWRKDDYIIGRSRGMDHNRETTGDDSGWKGERLFTEDELNGAPALPNIGRAPTLTKYLGPSVPCPHCKKNITQIPCECGMDEEAELEAALIDLFEGDTSDYKVEGDGEIVPVNGAGVPEHIDTEYSGPITQDGVPIRSFNPDGEQLALPYVDVDVDVDVNDVEDMNAYGMSCGLDALPADHGPRCGCGCQGVPDYTPKERPEPNWKEVDEAIRASGIKILGSD